MAAGRLGDGKRQAVGAPVAAQQRHDGTAVGGNGDDRGFLALVGQERRKGADQDSGGADSNDGAGPAEQVTHMRRHLVEDHVGAFFGPAF